MARHVWEIRLFGEGWYDDSETLHLPELGTRTHVGYCDEAKDKARRTRVKASSARISRVAVVMPDGRCVPFADHEIYSFSIGLD